ncbi:hypothetical protein J3R30DRAFT_3706320 [Lentinula aciculospora]|uniref:BTB domain-containing protein n=1 Tax=Lentinula aciculospora TaxID=153920 RepID=A0A9W9DL83_9AGAR|nr:hypothetical protein J3R30DRAFT_3706320 [Lentinula aciculospora]
MSSIPASEAVHSSLDTTYATLYRPFPPPSLAGVPFEYILGQLRNMASSYWGNSESSDCTLVIPVPYPQVRATSSSPCITTTRPSYDPSGLGRRVTEPSTLAILPRITIKLHSEYLSAHSSFLRSLFSGASPLDLINSAPSTHPTPNTPLRTPSGRFTIPADRMPRLLNSSPAHPVLFLPVPDPSSIDLVFHWMYFGNIRYIRDSLHDGHIQWEGIARNVEYLGLSDEIKVFLGDWYARWVHADRRRSCEDLTASQFSSDSESDSVLSDYDEEVSDLKDEFSSDETLVSDLNDGMGCLDIKHDIDVNHENHEGSTRGRGRTIRGLFWTIGYEDKFPDASTNISNVRRPESPVPPHYAP